MIQLLEKVQFLLTFETLSYTALGELPFLSSSGSKFTLPV